MTGSRLADDRTFAEVYHSHFEYAWACLRRLGVAPSSGWLHVGGLTITPTRLFSS